MLNFIYELRYQRYQIIRIHKNCFVWIIESSKYKCYYLALAQWNLFYFFVHVKNRCWVLYRFLFLLFFDFSNELYLVKWHGYV